MFPPRDRHLLKGLSILHLTLSGQQDVKSPPTLVMRENKCNVGGCCCFTVTKPTEIYVDVQPTMFGQ